MEVKERPIIFCGDMVCAILDGKKSATRRVIKPQPSSTCTGAIYNPSAFDPDRGWYFEGGGKLKCPYGRPGDLLWVRETWAKIWECEPPDTEDLKESPESFPWHIEYKANSDEKYPGDWPEDEGDNPDCAKWQSSRFMFKKYARLWLRITNVRVERVQEIRLPIAEGIEYRYDSVLEKPEYKVYGKLEKFDQWTKDPRWSFETLWNSLNAKRGYSWESNPYIWVVEFERVK